ncbi:MAG TPA: hypothetical protein VN176_04850 [Verrucomicrobiae bacterium]|jgi:hypothetical protein|nr:hypothetical protein [Verrucomicrobiae bacterium]
MKPLLLTMIVEVALLSYGQSAPSSPTQASHTSGTYQAEPGDRPPLQVLSQDASFAAKVQKLLGDGTTPQQACDGFKKTIDCVSAIHASVNLGIPLPGLKGKMTGKTAENLEKAIHDLKPDADAKSEKKKAQKQAEHDIPAS